MNRQRRNAKKGNKQLSRGKSCHFGIASAALVLAALLMSVSPVFAGAQYNWKISQGIAEDHPAAKRCKEFAALVEKESNGRIKMNYYPSGALGDWTEQIEANRMGTLEIGLNAGSTSYDPRANLMFMPYLFSSWDEARAAIGSDGWLTPIFNEIYSGIGLHVLGIFLNAWDGMAFTNRVKEVVRPPVEAGIKMRVPPIRIFEVYIPTLGFISTPIAYSETFTALQTGIVDARSACPAVEAYVMRDALSYWVATKDAFEYWFLTINKQLWEDLSKEDQALLTAAADKVMAEQAMAAEQDEQGFMDKLKASGVDVYQVSDAQWKKAARVCREKAWPMIEEELLGSVLMEELKQHATPLD
jgi:TRAP-type C4-dicarboxylate transport system substrate-binding protein